MRVWGLRHARAKIFLALYCSAIIYLSLYPWEFHLYPRAGRLDWVPPTGRRQILDAVLNFFFYVPLGAAGMRALGPGWAGWLLAVLGGCGLSWGIEWLQLWSVARFGNLTDLTLNTLGAAAGASLALAAIRGNWLPEGVMEARAISRWRLDATGALLLGTWMLWQLFPFIPALALPRLTGLLTLLAPWSWQGLASALVGFAVLRTGLGRSAWLWAAFAALGAQAFLMDRALTPSSVCGAALGWLVAARAGGRWLAFALPAWLAFEELRPFQISGETSVFFWAPFATWYGGSAETYYPVIFGKLFLYISVIWTQQARGWLWALGLPGAILGIGEWAQQYLVGRTPESTDLVLLAAGGVLLALCKPRVA
jgi:VanZ family protein